MRVIVDEGIGDTSPLWQQFHAWLGERSAEIVWLATRYPAIPDVGYPRKAGHFISSIT